MRVVVSESVESQRSRAKISLALEEISDKVASSHSARSPLRLPPRASADTSSTPAGTEVRGRGGQEGERMGEMLLFAIRKKNRSTPTTPPDALREHPYSPARPARRRRARPRPRTQSPGASPVSARPRRPTRGASFREKKRTMLQKGRSEWASEQSKKKSTSEGEEKRRKLATRSASVFSSISTSSTNERYVCYECARTPSRARVCFARRLRSIEGSSQQREQRLRRRETSKRAAIDGGRCCCCRCLCVVLSFRLCLL